MVGTVSGAVMGFGSVIFSINNNSLVFMVQGFILHGIRAVETSIIESLESELKIRRRLRR